MDKGQAGGLRKLMGGSGPYMRFMNRRMPSGRRCKGCWVPFQGPFSIPFQLIQIRPSRKNPNMCTI